MSRRYTHTLYLSLGGDERLCRGCGGPFTPTPHQVNKRDFQCKPCRLKYRNEWYRSRRADRDPSRRRNSDADVLSLLLSSIEADPFGGCWLWAGALSRDGYGRIWFRQQATGAHRAAYTLFRGEIPADLTVDHLCRVTCCVNPAHLELVSNAENVRRSWVGRELRAHCRAGHPLSGTNLRIKGRERICRTCATESRRRRRAAEQRSTEARL